MTPRVDAAPDPDWYLDHVLVDAEPGAPTSRALLPVAAWRSWWRARERDVDARVAADVTGFVVRRAVAWSRGVGEPEIRRLVRAGVWTAPGPRTVSVVAAHGADEVDARRRHALATAAVLLRREGQVASARSAAILHGLPTVAVPDRPEISAAEPVTAGRHGRALVRSGAVWRDEIGHWYVVPVLRPARTLADLARHDADDAIMAADAALREGLVTPTELRRTLARQTGWPGVRRAREVLAMADGRAESPLESLVRLRLHDDGFPEPDLQTEIGEFRVDLLFSRQRLVLEADGRGKYREDALWKEKRRERALRRLGFRVERVIWSDMFRDWRSTSAVLREALQAPSSP